MAHSLRRDQIDDLIFTRPLASYWAAGSVTFLWFDQLALIRYGAKGGRTLAWWISGCLVAMALFAREQNIVWGQLMDFVALLTPVGLALGRLGNFINQELWGRATDAPWAMVFPNDPLMLPRHPSQLYQFALEGCALFLVLLWFSRRPRPAWSVSALFLIGYGGMRFVAEFFREPDAHIGFDALGWMTRGQLLVSDARGRSLLTLLGLPPKTPMRTACRHISI